MSLLSNPEQRRLSSHVQVDDEAWKKLYIGEMMTCKLYISLKPYSMESQYKANNYS